MSIGFSKTNFGSLSIEQSHSSDINNCPFLQFLPKGWRGRVFNSFHVTAFFLYPLKTKLFLSIPPENIFSVGIERFSDAFRGFRKRLETWNGLNPAACSLGNWTSNFLIPNRVPSYSETLCPDIQQNRVETVLRQIFHRQRRH